MTIRVIVFDIGGVLEIAPDLGLDIKVEYENNSQAIAEIEISIQKNN